MRLVLQRVSSASVRVDSEEIAAIGRGLLVLVGVEKGDSAATVKRAVAKLNHLRIFSDDDGRMNLSAGETGAEFLLVSQFTLAASLERGRRPSFDSAAPPDLAEPLFEELVAGLRHLGHSVATGRFGRMMDVALINQGPATFVLDLD